MMSWKIQTPRKDAATPRTADETMCVIGEVTLMESKEARLIRKPKVPCAVKVLVQSILTEYSRIRTVMREPQINVRSCLESPYRSDITPGSSPHITTTTLSTAALNRFVYQLRSRAESLRSLIAFLMTTA